MKSEIDLVEFIRRLKRKRKILLISAVSFSILFAMASLFMKDEYEVKTTLMPNITRQGGAAGLLESFGGLTNLPLAMNDEEIITSELFEEVFNSNEFFLALSKKKIQQSDSDSLITVSDFMKEDVSGNWIKNSIKWIRERIKGQPTFEIYNNGYTRLTYEEEKMINELRKRIYLEFKTNGFIEVGTVMSDPLAGASFIDVAVQYLTSEVIKFKTQKLKEDLEYVVRQHADLETEYLLAQRKVAEFEDENRNIISSQSRAKKEGLNLELRLKSEVYISISKKLSELQIQLKESTPLFSVIEPVLIPAEKSGPKRRVITVIGFIAGLIIAVGYILIAPIVRDFLAEVKHEGNEMKNVPK